MCVGVHARVRRGLCCDGEGAGCGLSAHERVGWTQVRDPGPRPAKAGSAPPLFQLVAIDT